MCQYLLRKDFNGPCPQPAKHIHTPLSVFIDKDDTLSSCKGQTILTSDFSIGIGSPASIRILVQFINIHRSQKTYYPLLQYILYLHPILGVTYLCLFPHPYIFDIELPVFG